MSAQENNGTIRLAGVVRESIVDGPGIRFTVFVQGCPHHCPGCHNPQTHDPEGGYDCAPQRLLEEIDRDPLVRGVTLSGGEPMEQAEALLPFAREVRARGRDLVFFRAIPLSSCWRWERAVPRCASCFPSLSCWLTGDLCWPSGI